MDDVTMPDAVEAEAPPGEVACDTGCATEAVATEPAAAEPVAAADGDAPT